MAKQDNKREIFVYAHWHSMKNPVFMGVLLSERLRGKEIFSFEYDKEWLKSGPSHLLDPNLQLYSGLHYLNTGQSNFGIFLDSSPDRWGRILLRRREAALSRVNERKANNLFETDYLLGVYDGHRMGALRFKLEKNGPYCVINQSTVDKVCAKGTLCDQTKTQNTFNINTILECDTYTKTTENFNVSVLPTTCTSANVHGCQAKTIQIFNELHCKAVCDVSKTSGTVKEPTNQCIETCKQLQAGELEVYLSPLCVFDTGCEPINYTLNGTSTIKSATNCQKPKTCENGDCTYASLGNLSCETQNYCDSFLASDERISCVHPKNLQGQETTVLLDNGNEVFCSDDPVNPNQNFGDYWCPADNFVYYKDKKLCIRNTAVCDQGFAGYLQNGCDNPLSVKNDYFGLYNNACFYDKQNSDNLYDEACCLQTTFGGYQVYQDEATALGYQPVKVY